MDAQTRELVSALHEDPTNPAALRSARQHLQAQGEHKMLAKLLEWWSDHAPDGKTAADALHEAALAAEQGGADRARIRKLCEGALSRHPSHEAALTVVEAEAVEGRIDPQGVLPYWEAFVLAAGTSKSADRRRRRLVNAYTKLKQYDAALNHCRSLAERDPNARAAIRTLEQKLAAQRPAPAPAPMAPVKSQNSFLNELAAERAFPSTAPPLAASSPPNNLATALSPPPDPVTAVDAEPPVPKWEPPRNTNAMPSAPPEPSPTPTQVARPAALGGTQPRTPVPVNEPPKTPRQVIGAGNPDAPLPTDVTEKMPSAAGSVQPRPVSPPRPTVSLPADIHDGFEPQLYTDEDDYPDDMTSSLSDDRFGVEQILREGRSGGSSGEGAPLTEVVRMRGAHVLETRRIYGVRGAVLGYRDLDTQLGVRQLGGRTRVRVKHTSSGYVQRANGQREDLPQGAATLVLREGDQAQVNCDGLVHEVKLVRTVRPAQLSGEALQQQAREGSKRYAVAGAIGLLIHVLGLSLVMLADVFGVQLQVEDRPQEEIFAEIRAKPPEERKPPPVRRIVKKPAPKPAPSEREVKIPKSLRRRLRSISKSRPKEQTSRVLSALTSPVQGDGQTLEDVVTNLDAVAPSGSTGAFKVGGTLAALEGGGVNIASGGGGDVGTIGGNAARAKTGKLTARRGKVRGKVRAMSVGSRVQGTLSRGQVMGVINSKMGRIQRCFEKALTKNPSVAGRITYRWTISRSGKVTAVQEASSTLGDRTLSRCVSGVIKTMRFPKPKGGSVTVVYPFMFRKV